MGTGKLDVVRNFRRYAYREVGDERQETSSHGSPPDVLGVEVMIAHDGEHVHDDEEEEQRRRHPLSNRLHQGQDENLEAADVVQDAEDADNPQRAADA